MSSTPTSEISRVLSQWLTHGDPAKFPYQRAVTALRRHGKHFTEPAVLDLLVSIRNLLGDDCTDQASLLRAFLDNALDSRDGSHSYRTYTGLAILEKTRPDQAGARDLVHWRDRLHVLLIADFLCTELAVAPATPGVQANSRGLRRSLLALRALAPAADRLGINLNLGQSPDQSAQQLVELVFAEMAPREELALQISLLPVDALHDELMFIRILQASEITFIAIASCMEDASDRLQTREIDEASESLEVALALLDEARLLFPLLGTMKVEVFRRFRQSTVGASAIQSEAFKYIESRCATPSDSRLQSIAYGFVPDVREEALSDRPTIDAGYRSLVLADGATADVARIRQSLRQLNSSWHLWKQTHYRMAKHFLGDSVGTGYTEGPPYLGPQVDSLLMPSVGEP